MVAAYPVATRGDAVRAKVSSLEIPSLSIVGTVRGVAPLGSSGRFAAGTGRLRSRAAIAEGLAVHELSWREPGSSTWGPWFRVGADGSYLLEGGEDRDAWLRVAIYTSYLLDDPAESRVLAGERYNGWGPDDVSAAEASAGAVETFQVELTNDHPTTGVHDLKAWINASCAAGIEISDDNATWVTPDDEEHGDVLSWPGLLGPGDSETLYLRRTIGAGASSAVAVLNLIDWSWTGH